MKPHKHAELIKAWADGAEIEIAIRTKDGGCTWLKVNHFVWEENCLFRIKPDKKPDVVEEAYVMKRISGEVYVCQGFHEIPNVRFVWDGGTGKLKSAEVLK